MPSNQIFNGLINGAKKLSKTTERNTIGAEGQLQQIRAVRDELTVSSNSNLQEVNAPKEPLAVTSPVLDPAAPPKTTPETTTFLSSTIRPKSSIIVALQRESDQVRRLSEENQLLKQLLLEHQIAFEFILSRYRKKVLDLLECIHRRPENVIDQLESEDRQEEKAKIVHLSNRFLEMAQKYKEVIGPTSEKKILEQIEIISQLEVERNGLAELYRISKQYGSLPQAEEEEDKGNISFFDVENRKSIVDLSNL